MVHMSNSGVRPQHISSEYDEEGSIADEGLDNIEVQVLVGSKRRSKLRVVNPDEDEKNSSEEDNLVNISKDSSNEEKPRCSSSSSQQTKNSEVRKRVISDEHHDESFL